MQWQLVFVSAHLPMHAPHWPDVNRDSGCTGPHLSDLAWAIMREISRMSYNVSDSDIVRARNQLKASLLFAQDNPSGMGLLAPICPSIYLQTPHSTSPKCPWRSACQGTVSLAALPATFSQYIAEESEHCLCQGFCHDQHAKRRSYTARNLHVCTDVSH